MTNYAIPITAYRMKGGGAQTPELRRFLEKATQSFVNGTPVQIEAGVGYLQECGAIVSAATAVIAGFTTENASNLTTAGTAKTLNTGAVVPNQASAVVIPLGAPLNLGDCGVAMATDLTEFVGRIGYAVALAATHLNSKAGLTEDATGAQGFWYVDTTKSSVAGGACVQITELIDVIGTYGGRVAFRVLSAAQQFGPQAVGS